MKGDQHPCVMSPALHGFVRASLKGSDLSIPWAQNGIILVDGARLLLMRHIKLHQLGVSGVIQSDSAMMEAFGGIIPAGLYIYDTATHRITIPIDQIQHYQTTPSHTYGILQESWPEFNPERFDPKFIERMVAANVYRYDRICEDPYLEEITHSLMEHGQSIEYTLPQLAHLLKSKEMRTVLLQEYAILTDHLNRSA